MKKRKFASLCLIFGFVFLLLEVFIRVFTNDPLTAGVWKYASLAGWTSLWMIPIGGLSGALIGLLDEFKHFQKKPMMLQALIGGLLITVIEFFGGLIVNVLWGLQIWDYSTSFKLNILGQIALIPTLLWTILCPFGFWLDNVLRFYIYGEERPGTLWSFYKKLITLK